MRDLWEGASLEGRELPWTRKERKKKRREERKKEVRGSRTGVLSVRCGRLGCVNECYVQSVGPNLQPKGYTGKGKIERQSPVWGLRSRECFERGVEEDEQSGKALS